MSYLHTIPRALLLIILLSQITTNVQGQHTADTGQTENPLSLSGYMEIYYGYDLGQPPSHNRPSFVYSHNRHHEVNVNLAFLKAAYNNDNVRANLALGTGTYMNANYAAEPGVLKNIFEANAGIRLSSKHNIWIDAGVLPSHIGFESAQTSNCLTLTRSMLADNSPYYETGVRVEYSSDNGKWYLAGLVLNGWQRIQRVPGNNAVSAGLQLTYHAGDKLTLNYSSFAGNDKPDLNHSTRFFHNFYCTAIPAKKLKIIAGFDYGTEQKYKGSSAYNTWLSPVLVAHYMVTDGVAVALRGEYYRDANGVIIQVAHPGGFSTLCYSANADVRIRKNVLWRTEAKLYQSEHPVFTDSNGNASDFNAVLTTSLSAWF